MKMGHEYDSSEMYDNYAGYPLRKDVTYFESMNGRCVEFLHGNL
jgi:hypothetical protein